MEDHTPQKHKAIRENFKKPLLQKHRDKLNIATLNTRTLKSQESLLELEYALETVNWDIVGLSEIRRADEKIEEHEKFILYYKNEVAGLYGVGFIVKKCLKNNIIGFYGVSDRIAVLTIMLPIQKQPVSIVQVYAPTETTKLEIKNHFYNKLNEVTKNLDNTVIIMGDFNAQIGKRRTYEDRIIGPFTTGKRNENGQKLIDYALENNLQIMNSYNKRKFSRKWTWISPDGKRRNEIDYIITNKPKLFSNIDVVNRLNFNSDHRMLRGQLHTVKIKTSRKYKHKIKLPITLPISENILDSLEDKLKILRNIKGIQEKYDALEKDLKEIEVDCIKSKTTKDKLGSSASLLIEQRKILFEDRKTNRKEIVKLSKEINQQIRKHRQKHRTETINYSIEKSGGVKKAWQLLRESSDWIENMTQRRTKRNKTNRTEILKIATDFYRELYDDETTLPETNQPILYRDIEEEEIPNILREEVGKAIKSQKTGKAPGEDCISNELLLGTSDIIINTITDLFNEIIRTEYIPQQWTTSTIILLHKKGKKNDITNYRPISLMSNLYKIFSKTILDRLTKILDENQPKEQAGFRCDFSTLDHIHTIKQVIQKSNEYGITYYLAFVDYNKAFDSLRHVEIWEALETQGINKKYIRLIHNIYKNMKAKIRTERVGEDFPIKRGVRQGDPLSPKLFSAVLEHVFRRLEWNKYGLNINGVQLTHLRFADDLILISSHAKGLQEMLEQLVHESEKAGLSMNTSKTKLMTNGDKVPIMVSNTTIEYVEEYTYLGQIISPKDLTTKEISNRINLAWKRYWSLKEIMKNPQIPLKSKKKIFDSCILPIMTYGCQTWSLTQHNMHRLETCQHSIERSMLNVKLRHRIKLKTIRKQTKLTDVTYCIKKLKWRWTGHMMRNKKDKWAKDVTEWYPRGNKRNPGRPSRRWEDDIKRLAGGTWRRKIHDRKLWQALGEAYAGKQDNLSDTGVEC